MHPVHPLTLILLVIFIISLSSIWVLFNRLHETPIPTPRYLISVKLPPSDPLKANSTGIRALLSHRPWRVIPGPASMRGACAVGIKDWELLKGEGVSGVPLPHTPLTHPGSWMGGGAPTDPLCPPLVGLNATRGWPLVDDPEYGLILQPPVASHPLDTLTMAHASGSEVGIIVPTQPRYPPLRPSPLLPTYYFTPHGRCGAHSGEFGWAVEAVGHSGGNATTQRMKREGEEGYEAFVATLGLQCSEREDCVAFDDRGKLYAFADGPTCLLFTVGGMKWGGGETGGGSYAPVPTWFKGSSPTGFPSPMRHVIDSVGWWAQRSAVVVEGGDHFLPGPFTCGGAAAALGEERAVESCTTVCAATPGCVGFTLIKPDPESAHSGRLLAHSPFHQPHTLFVSPSALQREWHSVWVRDSSSGSSSKYSSTEPPPAPDYLIATVIGLVEAVESSARAQGKTCGWSSEGWAPSSSKSGGGGGGGGWEGGEGAPLPPLTHIFVVDTSSSSSSSSSISISSPRSDFQYLQDRFGHSPCITFLPQGSYPVYQEVKRPSFGRASKAYHPENAAKGGYTYHPNPTPEDTDAAVSREEREESGESGGGGVGLPPSPLLWRPRQRLVRQTLDYASALRVVGGLAPNAHMLLWEDDTVVCPGALEKVAWGLNMAAAAAAAGSTTTTSDGNWGGMRLGDGGSVTLIPSDLVTQAIIYLLTRRGTDPVDVSLWRFVTGRGAGEFILASGGVGAHRGEVSAMDGGGGGGGYAGVGVASDPGAGAGAGVVEVGRKWGRVACGTPVSWYWGEFAPCSSSSSSGGGGGGSKGTPSGSMAWMCSLLHGLSSKRLQEAHSSVETRADSIASDWRVPQEERVRKREEEALKAEEAAYQQDLSVRQSMAAGKALAGVFH